MQLSLKYAERQDQKLAAAILVRGNGPQAWLHALDGVNISLADAACYALPGGEPNTLSGCLIITLIADTRALPPTVTCLKLIADQLFIPLHSVLFPVVNDAELSRLLPEARCLMHPEIGFVALEEQLDWKQLIVLPHQAALTIVTPANPVFLPSKINRFEIRSLSEEEELRQLEEKVVPEKKTFADKPLSTAEKLKLAIYQRKILALKHYYEDTLKRGDRRAALDAGRNYYGALRKNKVLTIYDEQAITNDLSTMR